MCSRSRNSGSRKPLGDIPSNSWRSKLVMAQVVHADRCCDPPVLRSHAQRSLQQPEKQVRRGCGAAGIEAIDDQVAWAVAWPPDKNLLDGVLKAWSGEL